MMLRERACCRDDLHPCVQPAAFRVKARALIVTLLSRRDAAKRVIRAIIFDLGRVIVPFDFTRGYKKLEALCGIPTAEIPGRLAATKLVQQLETGDIDSRAFVREISSCLNLTTTYENFCEIWSSVFLPETLISDDFLQALAREYPLILLSNTNEIHFEMIRASYPLLRHFRSYVLSYRVGAMKPSPVIYRKAVEAAGCKPCECFFTDDIQAYVDGAKDEGIDAVQFQSADQIEAELRKRGVTWNAPPTVTQSVTPCDIGRPS